MRHDGMHTFAHVDPTPAAEHVDLVEPRGHRGMTDPRARAARRGLRRAPDARLKVIHVHVAADGDARLVLAAETVGPAADHRQAVAAPGQRRVAALLELVPPRPVLAVARLGAGG